MGQQQKVSEILSGLGKLKADTIAAKYNGKTVDIHTNVPEGAELTPIASDHPDALAVIRHSTAHLMADAVQKLFPGTKVAFGPATDNGFYYDYQKAGGGNFNDEDLRAIEVKMAEIAAQDTPFRRETIAVDDARKLLSGMNETFKLEHLERLALLGVEISLYRHGDWVDLCEGPHVPSTKYLKAFRLTTVAGAYWRGDERNPMLQRIYGTAFANQKALDAHLKQLEEAKLRDHRKLGKELDLIAFHPWAPASPFFLARGAKVYQGLIDYVRELYRKFGYEEVVTPQVFDRELFLTSGHLPSYAENMYLAATSENIESICGSLAKTADAGGEAFTPANVEKHLREELRFAMKPMNCPGHALLFGMERKSYRQLPVRMADFGRLHRFERSGVTQGLTRVRTFCQDDAHIFCSLDQIHDEIVAFIDLVYSVYEDFGFKEVRVAIATRPDGRLGTEEEWDKAEAALVRGVEARGLSFESAPGEGAFYGPKIEFHLKDALGRSWQLGTMQVDFILPHRFDLSYVDSDNQAHRPVMLHRAVLGSIERFYGVLLEHVNGSFPTWLAPEQIAVVTVHPDWNEYANKAATELRAAGIRVITDLSNEKLGAKIRTARNMRIPYIGVVGEKEAQGNGLAVRSRDLNADVGFLTVAQAIERIQSEQRAPSLRAVP